MKSAQDNRDNTGTGFTRIDKLIVAGRLGQARKALAIELKSGRASGRRLEFAKLCRRLDLSMTALRLLHPAISVRGIDSAALRSEYAACLSRLGAHGEAERMFSQVAESEDPEVLLHRAFNFFAQWNYAAATPLLVRYAQMRRTSPYQYFIARVNLAIALNYERDPSAQDLLNELIAEGKAEGYKRLTGTLFLQKAQNHFYQKNWREAFASLEGALKITDPESLDQILIEKWISIVSFAAYPERRTFTEHEIEKLCRRAEQLGHFETRRSCDYHRAVLLGDESLAKTVIFGTPHRCLRQRLLEEFPYPLELSDRLQRGPRTDPHPYENFLLEGGTESPLRYGQLGHRLLLALSSDFYQPMKMAELHGYVFRGEKFNPMSSPIRIRKLVERVREALMAGSIPINVRSERGMLSLVVPRDLTLTVPLSREVLSPFKRVALPAEFTAKDVAKVFQMNRSKVARMLRQGRAEKQIQTTCGGKYSRYRLVS